MNAVTASILLWHYYNSEHYQKDTDHGRSCSVTDGYDVLVNRGLLTKVYQKDGDNAWFYAELTERGNVLVKHWLNTPMPTEVTTWEIVR